MIWPKMRLLGPAWLLLLCSAGRAAPPPLAELPPNAVQARGEPMRITLYGPAGQTVYLWVLRDCDNDLTQPEFPGRPGCPSPLRAWSVRLDDKGQAEELLRKDEPLPLNQGRPLPAEVPLWLRVGLAPDGRRDFSEALFGIVENPCTLLQALAGLLGQGRCDPKLGRALGPLRGDGRERPTETLEVRRLDPFASPRTPRPVPGTAGATGAAWEDQKSLLVTLAAASEPIGLYRVDADSGRRRLLLKAETGSLFSAPLPLGNDRIALVRESLPPEPGGIALLLIERERVVKQWPLRHSVHQLLGFAFPRLFLISRVGGGARLFLFDPQRGSETVLPRAGLLGVALPAPGHPESVLAYEDAGNDDGWNLALLPPDERTPRELLSGPGHDLLPAWRPDGKEILYLSEAGNRGRR